MAKGLKKKKKGKDEKDKLKPKRGKSGGELAEETVVPEPEPEQTEGAVTCRVVPEAEETGPGERGSPAGWSEASAPLSEEPILPKLIVQSYEGETVQGLYEGLGIAHFQGGHIYEGDFSVNTPSGHGTYIWTDGSTYVGDVKNGIRHGQGVFTSADQSISYTGEWYHSKRHGKGTIYYNEEGSSWYQGDWVNNVREGWGMRRYMSGNIYEGQWKNCTRHGEGTMSWISTNEEYTGQWENGIQHGFGIHTWFLKRVLSTQYPLRNQYIGQFVKGVRQGHGKFFYANGAMYSGEWMANKKHGLGTFIFKNGRTFEGEFLEDRMAEFPNFSIDGMNTPDLSAVRTQSPLEAGSDQGSGPKSVIRSVLQHNVELNIDLLWENIVEEDRQNEVLKLEYAILRHFTQLKKMYSFYSSLGHQQSPDNTFLLSQLQFWRFLKDSRFHHYGLSLANMDRILHGQFVAVEDTHSPFDTLLLGKFLSYIVILAYHIYHKEHKDQHPILEACFSKLMTNNLLPFACVVNGSLFQETETTTITLGYVNKCWDVYRTYCEQNRRPPNTSVMTMRHFLWMLKDLNLLNKHLTATRVVKILSQDNPAVSDGTYHNMDIEMVFLEFLEALLSCAAVDVTKRMLENSKESSARSSRVNLTHVASNLSVPLSQEPVDQVIVQEYISPEIRGTKSSSKKRGDTNGSLSKKLERKKTKASASSAEKSTKASAQHDRNKSAAWTKTVKKEELSQIPSMPPPVESWEHSLDSQSKAPEVLQPELKAARGSEEKTPPMQGPASKPAVKTGAELEFWLSQICFFFMKRLFPAYEHAEVLKVEAKKDLVRQSELVHQAKLKAEARARSKEKAITFTPETVENTESLSDDDKPKDILSGMSSIEKKKSP
ncbi:radial spoke head 10 homolog B isoform X3 [Narcine bancroftii]|uniref:radial spoke head 10 homolog B isoform X3 n=1 Tax=Narcine bancroftii TaxID=1343680 RepID=UPI003831546A